MQSARLHALPVPANALVICCGPAASGKTTFAERNFRPTQIVSSDKCRALVGDDEDNQAISGRAFDLFYRIIEHRLALGRLTVADSTAIATRARRALRRLARKYGRPAVLIAFDVSLAACQRNNSARVRRVPSDVIRRQRARFREEARRFAQEGYSVVYRLDASTVGAARVQVVPL